MFSLCDENRLNLNRICHLKKGSAEDISLCFDNNMINFDFKDKYILFSLSIVLIQWIRKQSSFFLIV